MPLYTIEDSKFVSETISIVQDFSDMLVGGETIVGTPTIVITLLTGIDSNPNNLLYMGITTLLNKVEQRFRLGIPGCIYSIIYTVVTTFPHTYEKETFLAVLPMEGNVNPQFIALVETSTFYPYELYETLHSSQNLLSGRLAQTAVNFLDALKSTQMLSTGSLTPTIIYITYGNTHEDLKTTQTLVSGVLTLTIVYVTYGNTHEDFKTSQALINGSLTLTIVYVSYNNEVESFKSTQMLSGGTLA